MRRSTAKRNGAETRGTTSHTEGTIAGTKPLSYTPSICNESGMEQIAVNRAERMRVRGLNEARKGNYAGYWKLVNLSFEVGAIAYGTAATHE